MTEEQKAHAAQLGDEVERRLVRKYSKGVEEHGGNIWELDPMILLEEALAEVTDLSVYLLTLKKRLQDYRPSDIEPISKEKWLEGYHNTDAPEG